MVDDTQLAESKAIHRRTGTTFYVATRLLPERVRHATYVLYAFFRVADEIVDDPNGPPPAEQRTQLARLREGALGGPTDDSVVAAFSDLREQYGIPDTAVEEFVDAMVADIDTDSYETHEELDEYMGGSAAAVGEMMTAVMQPDNPEIAQPHARTLGEAFQLTNFLRDVHEDVVERDRIYLPQEILDEHGVSERQIKRFAMDDDFAALMRSELERTEKRYREGVAGIKYLPDDCQLPVLLAAVLYADHHRLIRDRGHDTLSMTPELSSTRKLSLLVRTRWHWLWNKDPEAVFAAVSTISDSPQYVHEPEGVTPTR
jgi:phytoene synthase